MVAALCFPDILRYEVGTPAVFGFAKRKRATTTIPIVMAIAGDP